MQVTFVKHVMDNGSVAPESFSFERDARASGLWRVIDRVVTQSGSANDEIMTDTGAQCPVPTVIVAQDNGDETIFADYDAFADNADRLNLRQHAEVPVACW